MAAITCVSLGVDFPGGLLLPLATGAVDDAIVVANEVDIWFDPDDTGAALLVETVLALVEATFAFVEFEFAAASASAAAAALRLAAIVLGLNFIAIINVPNQLIERMCVLRK